MRRIAVYAVLSGALLYGVHRLAMVAVARLLVTVAVTAFAVSPLSQLFVYVIWHWAERDYVAVIDYAMDATGLPERALMVLLLGMFAGYAVVFWVALRQAWDRARPGQALIRS
ncbi:hypothetical protein [Nonomuraea fuscirosea]|uniref:hypothetical protein n=1 Tax=Nonomuraea fuscirosea TaxID=1291556 RepID=UPI0033C29720